MQGATRVPFGNLQSPIELDACNSRTTSGRIGRIRRVSRTTPSRYSERVRPDSRLRGEPPGHEPQGADMNPRPSALGVAVVRLHETSLAVEPTERALHDPALRNDLEAGGSVPIPFDDFDRDVALRTRRRNPGSSVDAVDEH